MTEQHAAQQNRLAQETSPYLLQHRNNPVEWYPWGTEALDKARRENKPILLSVGYAACHWCHVMAHESFEDPEVAAQMNRLFVNIKVDREERPDLDGIYQSALALLGEQGGWPLTMFLTPRGEPFWGGTYFPAAARFGRPGFTDVLQAMSQAYHEKPEAVQQNVSALHEALQKLSSPEAGQGISLQAHDLAARSLVRHIDPVEGGLGSAPKFPQPPILKLLWLAGLRSGREEERNAVLRTLERMSQGGIYDHLGGGYARYATDDKWLVPHFEKMLYDNAQILDLLNEAWKETANLLYARRIHETVDWMLREMRAQREPGGELCGGFASSLDADSEGEEGRFYVWSEEEIDRILGKEAPLFKEVYDVRPGGNWEGKTILNRSMHSEFRSDDEEDRLATARELLFQERSQRVRPGWDDKVLADWNGLTIAALARVAFTFRRSDWLATAEAAFAFVRDEMSDGDRLFHSWRYGQLQHKGMLDDYAQMASAALTLHEITGQSNYLEQAERWVDSIERHFRDSANGGYFITADDSDDVVIRPKNAHDNAVPSGNGTLADVLARLYHLTGNDQYLQRCEELLTVFSGELERTVFPYATLLNAAVMLQDALQLVLMAGEDAQDDSLLETIATTSAPHKALLQPKSVDSLPPLHPAAGKTAVDGRATVYLCRGQSCSLPLQDTAQLRQSLLDERLAFQADISASTP
ncbi:thioredoxin domain-containing protein [Fodinicurvata halophila]|uniref:Thioredoxin domain-containing protein n=1 Tax=Fodinicurvata halophila TaxID=1419723 RepID=A0ABV8UN38_9PROT